MVGIEVEVSVGVAVRDNMTACVSVPCIFATIVPIAAAVSVWFGSLVMVHVMVGVCDPATTDAVSCAAKVAVALAAAAFVKTAATVPSISGGVAVAAGAVGVFFWHPAEMIIAKNIRMKIIMFFIYFSFNFNASKFRENPISILFFKRVY
jgi:hypothetical protein